MSDGHLKKLKNRPTGSFRRAPTYYGSSKTIQVEIFVPSLITKTPLRYLQGDSDVCAYASLASAIFYYARKAQYRKQFILQNICAGLEHLNTTHPPSLFNSFQVVLDYLHRQTAVSTTEKYKKQCDIPVDVHSKSTFICVL